MYSGHFPPLVPETVPCIAESAFAFPTLKDRPDNLSLGTAFLGYPGPELSPFLIF